MGYAGTLRTNKFNQPSNNPWFSGNITNNQHSSTFNNGNVGSSFNPYKTDFNIGQSQNMFGNDYSTGQGFRASQGGSSTKGAGAMGVAQGVGGMIEGGVMIAELNRDLNAPREYFEGIKPQAADTMINGVPSYSGVSSLGSEYSAIDHEAATKGMELKGVGGGAKAGAAIGGGAGAVVGTIVPVIGNVVGAAVGTAVGAGIGAGVGWLASHTKKGKAQIAAMEAQQRVSKQFLASQENYNEDVEDYYGGIDAQRQETQAERNYAQRLYGVNQYNDPFRQLLG